MTLRESVISLVDDARIVLDIPRTHVFAYAAESGLTRNWLRERYYGRAVVVPQDLVVVQALVQAMIRSKGRKPMNAAEIERPQVGGDVEGRLVEYADAVADMCLACCGYATEPKCWDSTCPLRSVSPLQLEGVKA